MAAQSAQAGRERSQPAKPDLWLDRMAAHLRASGDVGISLRELAAVAGTSHFLLSYYFGSRHGVLGAVLHHLRGQDVRVVFEGSPSRRAALESGWRHYTGPAGSLELRLFYHLVGLAAGNAQEHAAFVEGVVSLWTDPLTRMGVEEGLSPEQAAIEARYLIGAQRGLLLDWVLTHDEETERAFMALLDAILGVQGRGRVSTGDRARRHQRQRFTE